MLRKIISPDQTAVIVVADLQQVLQEWIDQHQAWPPATKHVGQAMLAACMIQALSDQEEDTGVLLQWKVDGAFGSLVADAFELGKIRCLIQNPKPPLVTDYQTGLGRGILQISRRHGNLANTGFVSAQGDIPLDVQDYLEQSEQRTCGIHLLVRLGWKQNAHSTTQPVAVLQCTGYLVHILPQSNPNEFLGQRLRWHQWLQELGPMKDWSLQASTPEQRIGSILELLSPELSGQELPRPLSTQLSCTCSEEKVRRVLALTEPQAQSRDSSPPPAVVCEFCGKSFHVM